MTTGTLLPGIEIRDLHSNVLNQNLRLYVKLPWSYERSSATHPVLFCLDGNRSFSLYSTMSLIYETPGTNANEILIVGIGYQLDANRLRGLAQWAAWRTRDFLPRQRGEAEAYWKERITPLMGGEEIQVQSGGAALFLQSLQEEIIPFVEANYRADPAERGLAGYSYSGLFALYTLLNAPQFFTRYFAGSPTMFDELFEFEANYASAHRDLQAQLFITAGSDETNLLEPIRGMVELLQSRRYPGFKSWMHVFEDEGHVSAYAASVSRALRVLYYGGDRKD